VDMRVFGVEAILWIPAEVGISGSRREAAARRPRQCAHIRDSRLQYAVPTSHGDTRVLVL